MISDAASSDSIGSVFEERRSTRSLWSSRRCLVFFAIALAVFGGIVVAAFTGIELEPSRPARFVRGADGPRVVLDGRAALSGEPVAFRARVGADRWGTRIPIAGPAESRREWRVVEPSDGPIDLSDATPGVILSAPVSLWEFARGALE